MPTNVFASTKERDAMLSAYFNSMSAPRHLSFSTLDQWKARRAEVKKRLLRSCGLDPMPRRIPLKPVYGGKLNRGDYTLSRVYLQSWPNTYFSGWLYMPKSAGKHPGILSPHGHWENGNMHPVPQSRDIVLAKKGYVVFAPDTVHMDTSTYNIGLSSVTVQAWDDFRGVDFLQSLPQVDPEKIGCTGASGGGLQTMYAMALDDRIKVAVPAVYVSYFEKIMWPGEGGNCICNWVPDLLSYTDEPEITALFAPKPTLVICVTGDWTAHVPTEEYPEMRSIWKLYGADGDIDCKQYDSGHDYSKPMREWMYAWFNKYLKGIDDPEAAKEPDFKVEELETMKSLDIPNPGASNFGQLPEFFRGAFHFKAPEISDEGTCFAYQKKVRNGLRGLLGDTGPAAAGAGRIEVSRSVAMLGMRAEKLRIRTEPEIEVPALLFRPEGSGRAPLTIVLSAKGKKSIVEDRPDIVRGLVAGGSAVLLPDVRLIGELGRDWDWNTVMWGRPCEGMAVTDLRACLAALADRKDLDPAQVALIGLDDAGALALMAGAVEPRFSVVAVDRIGKTYLAGRTRPTISNLLRLADLPEIASAIAPRRLILGGAGDAFDFTRQAYGALEAGRSLSMWAGEVPLSDLVQAVAAGIGGRAAKP